MWDLPRPGLEPVSPALAGRFSTTAPAGKPDVFFYVFVEGGELSVLLLCNLDLLHSLFMVSDEKSVRSGIFGT